ncbi:hypothetical protein NA57DRAFT_64897 [Rhizodiscina lignyota]|uniref:Uncharacterized protein n=1 Tax=Rhizodiscina lignyota TaxID=1504668 RepID=A0A9P4M727_9PEZI|nr:hypothetical protein NA57DRAFT_64897 [Rhizodiscina lignyota]
MASIEPSAGGQYHWVLKFSPPKHRRWLAFLVAVFNVFLRRVLPSMEVAVFGIFFTMFIALIAILFGVNLPPKLPAHNLVDFQDGSGWGSKVGACFVGISGPVITLIGSDCGVHLAEELCLSSRSSTMLWVFSWLAALLLRIGDLDSILATQTGEPFIQIFWNVLQHRWKVVLVVGILLFIFTFSSMNTNVTASRQLYAFAREGGVPFCEYVSKVSPAYRVPTRAVWITGIIGILISLLAAGSSFAFLIIQTIGNSGLLTSYIITISCRLYHRNNVSLYGTRDTRPPVFLGKIWGNIINITAIICAGIFSVTDFFPAAPHPTASTFNYSVVVWGGIGVLAIPVWNSWKITVVRNLGSDLRHPISYSE